MIGRKARAIAQAVVMWVWGAPIALSVAPDARRARNDMEKPVQPGAEKEVSR